MKGGIATLRDKIYIHSDNCIMNLARQRITNSLEQSWVIFAL